MTPGLERLVVAVQDAAVIGITGPVAAGKSTVAAALAEALGETVVLSADDFLLPNDVLASRDLLVHKGRPETYDRHALAAALDVLRVGGTTTVPVYSHDVYDIVGRRAIGPTRRVVVEGLHLLLSPVRERLDVAVYLDADLDDAARWYCERFTWLCASAGPGSFYGRFAGMGDAAIRSLAQQVWDGVNLPLSVDHVVPTRSAAHLVVRIGPDHAILGVSPP